MGAGLYAQSVLINKISAMELSQKFIKSALLVGSFFLATTSLCKAQIPPCQQKHSPQRMREEEEVASWRQ